MDDRHAQFLIAVGDLCVAAGLAGLEVRLRPRDLDDGEARGVPHPRLAAGHHDHVDDTGYASALVVDDRIVNLEDVVECTIYAPGRRP